jgi:hypothetical protein
VDLGFVAGLLVWGFWGGVVLSWEALCRWVLGELEGREWVQKAPVLGNA